MKRRQRRKYRDERPQKMSAACRHLKPEKILQLQQGDHHRDPRGKAGGHRVGNITDETSQMKNPHEQKYNSGHDAGGQPLAMASAMASGKATMPTVIPASRSLRNLVNP